MAKNIIKSLIDLKDLYKNSDVYIIGNGPDILNIDQKLKDKIQKSITIGCNISHLFIDNVNFYISGHWNNMIFNMNFGNVKDCRIFQGPTIDFDYDSYKCINVENINHNSSIEKFIKPTKEIQYLIGAEQITLSALHIAWIIGAKRIFFIGVDMKSSSHYYHDDIYFNTVKEQWHFLYNKFQGNPDILRDMNNFWNTCILSKDPGHKVFEVVSSDMKVDRRMVYWNSYDDHLSMFRSIFDILKRDGLEIGVFNRDSIIYEAGAKLFQMSGV